MLRIALRRLSYPQEPTDEDRLRYYVERAFETNPFAKPLMLGALTLSCIGTGMVTFILCGDSPRKAMWRAWTVVVDPGTHTMFGRSPQRAASTAFTLGGLFFFALLVGLVNDEISSHMDRLKQGKNMVVERDHVLMLNWSPKAVSCVAQMAKASQTSGGAAVVILADKDKQVSARVRGCCTPVPRQADCFAREALLFPFLCTVCVCPCVCVCVCVFTRVRSDWAAVHYLPAGLWLRIAARGCI